MGHAAGVTIPKSFALDGLVADGAGELARGIILDVRVLYAPCGALLAEKGASVGHFEVCCKEGKSLDKT